MRPKLVIAFNGTLSSQYSHTVPTLKTDVVHLRSHFTTLWVWPWLLQALNTEGSVVAYVAVCEYEIDCRVMFKHLDMHGLFSKTCLLLYWSQCFVRKPLLTSFFNVTIYVTAVLVIRATVQYVTVTRWRLTTTNTPKWCTDTELTQYKALTKQYQFCFNNRVVNKTGVEASISLLCWVDQ